MMGQTLKIQTLCAISELGNSPAGEIAKYLNITRNNLSNRLSLLKDESLIEGTHSGKFILYSLTDKGKEYLEKKNRTNSEVSVQTKLITSLEIFLKKSFDDAYLFLDLFFEKPFPALSCYYMQNSNDWTSLKDLYNNLEIYIRIAIKERYDKTQFFSHLISTTHCSNETKGLVYYIAEKYDNFQNKEVFMHEAVPNQLI